MFNSNMLEWTQDWIQNLKEENRAPTFAIEAASSIKSGGGYSHGSAGKSILRNGRHKRSVSWSKTIQVETFDTRDDNPEDELSDNYSDDEFDDNCDNDDEHGLEHPQSFDLDEEEKGDNKESNNPEEGTNEMTSNGTTSLEQPRSVSGSDDDMFAQVESSSALPDTDTRLHVVSTVSSDDDVFSLLSASSTVSGPDEVTDTSTRPEISSQDNKQAKPSSMFIPVLLPDNFRLENRLERTDTDTLSVDDRSLLESMDDTATLAARRAASDEDSIVSLVRKKKQDDDAKQRQIDGNLGHIGLVVPSLTGLWSALGLSEVEAVLNDRKEEQEAKKGVHEENKVENEEAPSEPQTSSLPVTRSISLGDLSEVTGDKYAINEEEHSEGEDQDQVPTRPEPSGQEPNNYDLDAQIGCVNELRKSKKNRTRFVLKLRRFFTRKKSGVRITKPANRSKRDKKRKSSRRHEHDCVLLA